MNFFHFMGKASRRHHPVAGPTLRALLLQLVMLVLVSCATTDQSKKYVSPDKLFSVSMDGNVITYRGLLVMDGVEMASDYMSGNPRVKSLSIESQGGEIDAGMKLGGLVYKNSLDVRVIGVICGSSCANYVFVSGKRKYIDRGALVMWHGSALRPESIPVTNKVVGKDGKEIIEEYKGAALVEYMKRPDIAAANEKEKKAHADFFHERGMDGRITVYGQEIGCDCNWTFSVDDMSRFGVDRVHADSRYPQPSALLGTMPVVTLKLDDRPGSTFEGKN